MESLRLIFAIHSHVLPAAAGAHTLSSYQAESMIFDLRRNVAGNAPGDMPQRLETYHAGSGLRYITTRVSLPGGLPEFPSQMRPDTPDSLP